MTSEDGFPNFGFEDKERTHIFSQRITWSPSEGGRTRTKVGPESDNLYIEINTMRHVQFSLLNCWINAQLPSPLLGSPHAQGVRHTSLTGWSNSHFSKDIKQNVLAV